MALDISLSDSKLIQQDALEQLAKTKDYREALLAFSEKRNPNFKGI